MLMLGRKWTITKYIIKFGKNLVLTISVTKTQKLLYYVQAWTLVLYDKSFL